MERKPIIGISGNILVTEGGKFNGYERAYVNQADMMFFLNFSEKNLNRILKKLSWIEIISIFCF